MRNILVLIIISVFIFNSCTNCEDWGDNNLGGEFTLLEGNKQTDRAVIYCVGRMNSGGCCKGGIPIIPSRENSNKVNYVELANFDDKWILIKGINYDRKISFWILDKDFDQSWEYDDGGLFYNRIQEHVYGPFDELTFSVELDRRGIKIGV